MQLGNRRGKSVQQPTMKVVKAFGVFFNAKQTALRSVSWLHGFGVADTNYQKAAFGIGKGTHCFVYAVMFATDALEIKRAALWCG